jgi:hypothetical protein
MNWKCWKLNRLAVDAENPQTITTCLIFALIASVIVANNL